MANAATLVLIPGLMCDYAVWAEQTRSLAPMAARLAVADHGAASSLVQMAQAILSAHTGSLALVGHSMGGRVALEMARAAPERVCGLALLDTGYLALPSGQAGEHELKARMAWLAQARRDGVRAMAVNWIQQMLHPQRLQDQVLMQSIFEMFERHTVEQFAGQVRALIERPDAAALLSQLHCPTLLLCGEQDQWSPPVQHRDMQARIAGSRLTCIPDCGHMAPMERPQLVSDALGAWFERCRAN